MILAKSKVFIAFFLPQKKQQLYILPTLPNNPIKHGLIKFEKYFFNDKINLTYILGLLIITKWFVLSFGTNGFFFSCITFSFEMYIFKWTNKLAKIMLLPHDRGWFKGISKVNKKENKLLIILNALKMWVLSLNALH